MEILKITAKSAPIPTIAAGIAYTVLPKLIERDLSTSSLIIISLLIFFIIFSILFYGIASKESKNRVGDVISENEAKELEAETGDIFIGDKSSSLGDISKNKITKAKTGEGDIFIGRKR